MKNLSSLRFIWTALVLVFCASCGESAAGKFVVIPKGTSHEFWKTVHAGAIKAAQDRGVEIIWKGPAREDDRQEQIKVVESYVTQGVAGILIAPLDDEALVGCLKEADKAGIPVVVFDSDVNWDGRKAFVATNNYESGKKAADAMAEQLGGKGNIVVLRYQEGSASTSKREQGFLDRIAAEHKGVTVLESKQYGGATVESCMAKAENLMTSHGDRVDGLFGPCEPVTFALMKVLSDPQNRARDIKLVGFDATDKLVEGLEKGLVHALVVQDPFAMGELGLNKLVDAKEGKATDPFQDTGSYVVTKANMGDENIRRLLKPDLDKWLK